MQVACHALRQSGRRGRRAALEELHDPVSVGRGAAEGESLVSIPRPTMTPWPAAMPDRPGRARFGPSRKGSSCGVSAGTQGPRADLDVGNAGAVLRFLLAVAALGEEIGFRTRFPDSLGKRPNGDLLRALQDLGVRVESRDGCLPIVVRGGRVRGGAISLSGLVSSQFLSALLFLAPLLPDGLDVRSPAVCVPARRCGPLSRCCAPGGHRVPPPTGRACSFRVPGGTGLSAGTVHGQRRLSRRHVHPGRRGHPPRRGHGDRPFPGRPGGTGALDGLTAMGAAVEQGAGPGHGHGRSAAAGHRL